MENKATWEKIFEYACKELDSLHSTAKMKVNGGEIYIDHLRLKDNVTCAMVFVPDVDLQRYQAHLRDAYNDGYKAGQEDARLGENYATPATN